MTTIETPDENMSRQQEHDDLSAQAKEQVFKTAYGNVKQFVEDRNFIAANVLAFAILEDRLQAAWTAARMVRLNSAKPTRREVNRNRFADTVRDLLTWGVIDAEMAQALHSNAHERNRLTHEMIWRLNSFTRKAAETSVRLSRKIDTHQRKFIASYRPREHLTK